jgi:hypothetical protein
LSFSLGWHSYPTAKKKREEAHDRGFRERLSYRRAKSSGGSVCIPLKLLALL